MGISFTKKANRTYCYYLCLKARKQGYESCPVKTVPAGDIENAVIDQLRAIFRSPEMVAETWRAARRKEEEERAYLALQKADLEKQLNILRATAKRIIDGIANDSGNNRPGIVGDELARLDAEISELEKQRHIVSTELSLYEGLPAYEIDVARELATLDGLWAELFPAEQARIVRLLVEQVVVNENGLEVTLKSAGLYSLMMDLKGDAETPKENIMEAHGS